MAIDSTNIQRIIRKDFDILYSKKLETFRKMNQFLGIYDLLKLKKEVKKLPKYTHIKQ
jgi:hypothetical protein